MSNFYQDIYDPIPKAMDIYRCYFPDRDYEYIDGEVTPYNCFHHCLILNYSESKNQVFVVYGTSQRTDRKYSNDLIVNKNDLKKTKLSKTTKWIFAADSIARLPYNERFFAEPVYSGTIPDSYKTEIKKITQKKSFKKIVNRLIDENLMMIPTKDSDKEEYRI